MRLIGWRRTGACIALPILLATACVHNTTTIHNPGGHQQTMPTKDINIVLKDHEQELLAIPGVVGVYVGQLADNKTLCLKILVIKETDELKQKLPKTIEGWPALIEESGIIRPMR